jgi:DNA polymerase V
MTDETLYRSAYSGTKNFSQADIQTANATGFGAAADDYSEKGIDLNEQLIMNKPATFFFKMNSDAMLDAGIHPGDVLIVDRSIKSASGKIIVAAVNGELMVRYFKNTMNKCWLEPANKRFRDISLEEFTEYRPWGVVTCVVHIIDPALIAFNTPRKARK